MPVVLPCSVICLITESIYLGWAKNKIRQKLRIHFEGLFELAADAPQLKILLVGKNLVGLGECAVSTFTELCEIDSQGLQRAENVAPDFWRPAQKVWHLTYAQQHIAWYGKSAGISMSLLVTHGVAF